MQIDHQQRVQQLQDDMRNKVAEYERNLKAAKEDAEKSMKWSHVSSYMLKAHMRMLNVVIMKFCVTAISYIKFY